MKGVLEKAGRRSDPLPPSIDLQDWSSREYVLFNISMETKRSQHSAARHWHM